MEHTNNSLIELEEKRLAWSFETFPNATALSSLDKLKEELTELRAEVMTRSYAKALEEYADCLMCLFDSAGRFGVFPQELFDAFEKKFEKNKLRTWKENPDKTYSHVK